jgi:hypothetical protein
MISYISNVLYNKIIASTIIYVNKNRKQAQKYVSKQRHYSICSML